MTAVMTSRQAAELDHAFERNGWTPEDVKKLSKGDVLSRVLLIVREDVEADQPLDFIIRVDCSAKSTYPNWMDKLVYPELECAGPAEYDLSCDVRQWSPDQFTGHTKCNDIYEALQQNNALANQLGLADLLAIQKKGIAVFRKFFSGKMVFGWKSVMQDVDNGAFCVPVLYERRSHGVVLRWRRMSDYCINSYQACFRD